MSHSRAGPAKILVNIIFILVDEHRGVGIAQIEPLEQLARDHVVAAMDGSTGRPRQQRVGAWDILKQQYETPVRPRPAALVQASTGVDEGAAPRWALQYDLLPFRDNM